MRLWWIDSCYWRKIQYRRVWQKSKNNKHENNNMQKAKPKQDFKLQFLFCKILDNSSRSTYLYCMQRMIFFFSFVSADSNNVKRGKCTHFYLPPYRWVMSDQTQHMLVCYEPKMSVAPAIGICSSLFGRLHLWWLENMISFRSDNVLISALI